MCSALRFWSRAFFPFLFIDDCSSISRNRVFLSSHPYGTTASLAEPGLGDAPCTTWALSVNFHPLHFLTGRSSSGFAFIRSSVFQPLPVFGFPRFLQPFQAFQFSLVFQPLPIFRLSPALRLLLTFPSSPALRPLPTSRPSSASLPPPVFRPSPAPKPLRFPATPTLRLAGFFLTGNSIYSYEMTLSKSNIR